MNVSKVASLVNFCTLLMYNFKSNYLDFSRICDSPLSHAPAHFMMLLSYWANCHKTICFLLVKSIVVLRLDKLLHKPLLNFVVLGTIGLQMNALCRYKMYV